MSKMLLAGAVLASAVMAAPAAAVTFEPVSYTFDFTGADEPSAYAYGNTISKTVGGITATVSAWTMDKTIGQPLKQPGGYNPNTYSFANQNVQTAYLAQYSGNGLGDINRSEDGSSPNHTVDNTGGHFDFILLQFSRPVQLLFGSLKPFTGDNDSWVSFSDVAPGSTPLSTAAVWNNMMLHATEVEGNLSAAQNYKTFLNPGMNTGYSWIIGADAFDGRTQNDGFKLSSFSVQLPVPEPATWASMILGIGVAGGALRRRRGVAGAVARA